MNPLSVVMTLTGIFQNVLGLISGLMNLGS